jgi:hypothetical protein
MACHPSLQALARKLARARRRAAIPWNSLMRIAILSDIQGNRTALEAVLADLCETAPESILHGGDLAYAGTGPVEMVDRIRDLGWPGVVGNTDEMIFRSRSRSLRANRRRPASPTTCFSR